LPTADGKELWFKGDSRAGYPGPAVFRSLKGNDGSWTGPEEEASSFAGEPTLHGRGNVHFAHHLFSEEMQMTETDIYVAYRK
jgi:hypothetical protein